MLLPIVLRIWVKMQGEIRRRCAFRLHEHSLQSLTRSSDIELKLFTRFWLFQVIQGFLIITLSSGLISALGNGITGSVPTLLAEKLPQASIFFLTL